MKSLDIRGGYAAMETDGEMTFLLWQQGSVFTDEVGKGITYRTNPPPDHSPLWTIAAGTGMMSWNPTDTSRGTGISTTSTRLIDDALSGSSSAFAGIMGA